MSSVKATSIREEYKEQTRVRILDAAVDLVGESGEGPLTIAAVAARASVTERTVYRHFETREALVRSLWQVMQQRVGTRGFPRSASALVESPRRLFPRFDAQRTLVRASLYSPAGVEVRMGANAERQDASLTGVREALPGLNDKTLRRRAAVVQLLNSAYAWDVMCQFWGLDGGEAGEAASEALAVLLGLRRAEDQS